MRKNNKITLTIVLAVVFAIGAGVCIFSLLTPNFTTLYVFNSPYKAGTVLDSSMVTPIEAPASIMSAGANTDASAVFVDTRTLRNALASGDSLKLDVAEGMPLMKSMLSVTGGSTIEMNMSPSKIAMTVEVDNITGVTEELTAGSSVNVYIMSSGSSFLLFENMRLLEVTRDSGGGLLTATLELTNNQAEALLNAQQTGKVYFGLINSSGYQYQLTGNKEPVTKEEKADDVPASVAGTEIETIPQENAIEEVPIGGNAEADAPADTPAEDVIEEIPQYEEPIETETITD